MDGLYRKGRYQEIIKKLNQIQGYSGDHEVKDKYQYLQDEVNKIIESLRNRGDQANARIHYILLIVPFVIVLAWHAVVFQSYSFNALLLILVAGGLTAAHFRMRSVIRMSHENTSGTAEISGKPKEFILTKMAYLDKAMNIKKSRLLLITLFYIIFFPPFLVLLHSVAISSIPFESVSMAYGVAYLISSTLWYFYFNRLFEIYDDIDESLKLIRSNL